MWPKKAESWNNDNDEVDLFWLKQEVEHVLRRLGLTNLKQEKTTSSYLDNSYRFSFKNKTVATFGSVNKKILKAFDIKKNVLTVEFNWDNILSLSNGNKTTFQAVSKFPSVEGI